MMVAEKIHERRKTAKSTRALKKTQAIIRLFS